jgi:hypothetical protein
MDDEFPERMLLAWLESNRQRIHDARQVVCRTKLHPLREDLQDENSAAFLTTASIHFGEAIILRSLSGASSVSENRADS